MHVHAEKSQEPAKLLASTIKGVWFLILLKVYPFFPIIDQFPLANWPVSSEGNSLDSISSTSIVEGIFYDK